MDSDILPEGADMDLTASAYVVKDGKVLFIKHRKTGFWLQPGGHIEKDELPHETARRETLEETGFEVRFLDEQDTEYRGDMYDLPRPFNVNLHKIRDKHWHCDLAYLAEVEDEREATHAHEHGGVRWVSREELRERKSRIPENVAETALEAIEKVSS